MPTLPASIPQYRYPPLSERSENLFRSRPMGLTGDKADKRYADQVVNQTSGDYGKFLIVNDDPAVRLHMKPVQSTLKLKKTINNEQKNINNNNNNNNNNTNTNKEIINSTRSNCNSSREINTLREDNYGKNNSSIYNTTLETIDFKAFPKHAKYNLRAAVQPPIPEHHYRGVATNNQLGYRNCLNWTNKLRSD